MSKMQWLRYIKIFKVSLILHVFISLLLAENVSSDSLRHLFMVYRHGDRAPIQTYPTDPNPESFWKEGLGQLTNIGKKQQYELGRYLRERYTNFMTDNIQEIYIRSSAVDRCLESAASNLASLYKPKDYWVWNKDLNWQPAPIHSVPLEIDSMLTVDSTCPEAEKEEKRIENGPESQTFLKNHKALFEYLTNYTGDNVTGWQQAGYIYDSIFIEKLYNLTIPSWVDPIWDELGIVSDFCFYIPFTTQLMHRLRGGSLVGDIVSDMEKQTHEGASSLRKIHMYSTHDNLISAFLSALGVFNNKKPPYRATVLIELHENGRRNHTVRMFYRNDTTKDPYPLVLPGCDADCPLGHFVHLTKDIIPDNWEEECGLKDEKELFQPLALVVICSMGVILLLLVLSTAVMLWLRCQKRQSCVRYQRVPDIQGQ